MRNEKSCCRKDITEVDRAIYTLAHMVDSLAERVETIESYIYDEDEDEPAEGLEDNDCLYRKSPCFWDYEDNGNWEPVKEMLPDELGEYLVTIERIMDDDGKEYWCRKVTLSQFSPKRQEWSESGVIAWMSLPSTYRGK